jgi:hypothetical protein
MSNFPVANLMIVAFLLAMIYWWSLQGFFSAFLHLVVVIVAGALAFALWEPLVFNFGMHMQPQYAWGLWLLGPFVLLVIVLRLATDRLIKMNVQFQSLFSSILGGACGLVSGVLTAGIAVIGLGFLPLPSNLGGYEPFVVAGAGQVEEAGSGLWVPVDRYADRTFARLSMAGFYTSRPLAVYQPDLPQQAALFRMRYDENASVIARPDSVRVDGVWAQPMPVRELPAAVHAGLGGRRDAGGQKAVVVDTTWAMSAGTFDPDAAVRIPPTQIRLVSQQQRPGGGGTLTFHAPVAFVHQQGDQRVFIPFASADTQAFGNRQTETFGWVFVVPVDQNPRFLMARHLRLELPDADTDPQAFVAAMGRPAPQEQPDAAVAEVEAAAPSEVGEREGIRAGHTVAEFEATNRLPTPTSRNLATTLRVQDNGVVEGSASVSGQPGSLSPNVRVDSIFIPSHQGAIRLRIAQDNAQSLLGQARVAAASLQGVWLTDERGDTYQPIGWVWHRGGSDMDIWVDRIRQVQTARDMPIARMNQGDHIYLYFAVPRGARIVSYNIGDTTRQEISPPHQVQ